VLFNLLNSILGAASVILAHSGNDVAEQLDQLGEGICLDIMRLKGVLIIGGDVLEDLGVDTRTNANGVNLDASIFDRLSMGNRVISPVRLTVGEHDEDLAGRAGALLQSRISGVEAGVHVGAGVHLDHARDGSGDSICVIGKTDLDTTLGRELDDGHVGSLGRDCDIAGDKGRELLHEPEVGGRNGAAAVDQESNVDSSLALGGLAHGGVGLENSGGRVIGEDVGESHGVLHREDIHYGPEDGKRSVLLGAERPVDHGELQAPEIAGLAVDHVGAVGKSNGRDRHGVHVAIEEADLAGVLSPSGLDDVADGILEVVDFDVLGADMEVSRRYFSWSMSQ